MVILYNFLKLNVANLHFSHGHIVQKKWKITWHKHTCHMIFYIISLIISTKKSTRVWWFCFLFLTKAKCKLWYFDGHLFSKVFKKYDFVCQFATTLMNTFLFFSIILILFEQISHDTIVFFEHFLKNIRIYITLLS